jgi:hypothetical protein
MTIGGLGLRSVWCKVDFPFTPVYADCMKSGTSEAEAKVLERERAYLGVVVSPSCFWAAWQTR